MLHVTSLDGNVTKNTGALVSLYCERVRTSRACRRPARSVLIPAEKGPRPAGTRFSDVNFNEASLLLRYQYPASPSGTGGGCHLQARHSFFPNFPQGLSTKCRLVSTSKVEPTMSSNSGSIGGYIYGFPMSWLVVAKERDRKHVVSNLLRDTRVDLTVYYFRGTHWNLIYGIQRPLIPFKVGSSARSDPIVNNFL